jgi:hypothetical protein
LHGIGGGLLVAGSHLNVIGEPNEPVIIENNIAVNGGGIGFMAEVGET